MKDLPADTTWFAVDEDGNVGRFETGEGGAVPNEAACAGNIDTVDPFLIYAAALLDVLVLETPGPERTFDRDDRAVFVLEPIATDDGATYRTAKSASTVDELVPEAMRIVLREMPRVIATRKPLAFETLTALGKHPDVRVLWTRHDLEARVHEDEHGSMFLFGNGNEPGEYRRQQAPARVMQAKDLPDDVRQDVESVKLPICFADVTRVHLADFMKNEDVRIDGIGLRGEPYEAPDRRRERSRSGSIALVLLVILGAWWLSRHW